MGIWRRAAAAALAAACVLCGGAASASGSTWSAAQLSAGSVNAALYGISCPTDGLCAAVGGNSTVAVSTDPSGSAASWRVGHPSGSIVLPEAGTYGGAQIRGVSCPAVSLCVAASLNGRFFSSTDPAGEDPNSWKVAEQADSGPNVHMFGISCPTTSFCVAVGYGGKVLVATEPTGYSDAWTVTALDKPYDFRGVSCPSADFCAAVGNEGQIVVSTDPTGGPSAWKPVGAPIGEASLNSVACPSESLCVTGSAGKVIVSTAPAVAGTWTPAEAGTGLSITGVSCPGLDACAAVDDNADALASTDPAGGSGAWWFQNVLPYGTEEGNGTFGISCPSTGFCAAVGQHFQVISSHNPFARDTGAAIAGPGRGRRLRVAITRYPPKRLDPRKGGVRVAFRFHAIGRAAKLQCKLDRRRFRPCRSPRRYRVGSGKHRFRVRAIGLDGQVGPPTSFHFRVGRLTEPNPVGSCKGDRSDHSCINAG